MTNPLVTVDRKSAPDKHPSDDVFAADLVTYARDALYRSVERRGKIQVKMIGDRIKRVLIDFRRSGARTVQENTLASPKAETEIVVEHLSGRVLRRVVSSSRQLTIGRSPTCTVQLDGAAVSRSHARLVIGTADAEVEDYSTNGTFVGDVYVHRGRLRVAFGMPIFVGTSVLRVQPLTQRELAD